MRSMTFRSKDFSRLRSCVGVRSLSKITKSAPAARATARTSLTLPRPNSVDGSGSDERCSAVPTTRAPALAVSSFSSRSESSASARPPGTPSRRVDSQPARNAFSKTCERRMFLSLRVVRAPGWGGEHGPGQHHRGDRVFEDHLFLMVAFQNDEYLSKLRMRPVNLTPLNK